MAPLLRFLAFCGAFLLAACSTIGPPAGRPIDALLDDIASLVITFDLPRGLGPTPNSQFTFSVPSGGPGVNLQLTPVPAEIDSLPVGLPPPGADRAYYFFVFTAADVQKLRDAQIAAQLSEAQSDDVVLRFIPRFCSSGLADGGMTVSILAVLPGRNPQHFIKNVKLDDLLKQAGGSMQIPACV